MNLPTFILEYIAIVGLILIGTIIFFFFFKDKTYLKWGLLLFLVITAAYFSMTIWLFVPVLFLLIMIFSYKQSDLTKLGYYFLLLPLIPAYFYYRIPLPGRFQQLFTLTYPLLFSLFILLPLSLKYVLQPKKRIFSYKIDKYVIVFLIFIFILTFRDATFTNSFRIGIFRFLMIYFLPYFVISRTVTKTGDFKKLLYPMIFIAFILALMAALEVVTSWHMYTALPDVLNINSGGFGKYQRRVGFLRTYGPFGQPIPFGVYLVIMVAFSIFLKYSSSEKFKNHFNIIFAVLTIGIVSTISRTPLIGYGVFFIIFILLTINKKETIKLAAVIILISLVIFLPLSLVLIEEKVGFTMRYREKLWKNSLKLIERSPLIGSNDYIYEPEMDLPSGYLSVDIANSYLQIVLRYGLIGVALYLLIFASMLFNLWKGFHYTKEHKTALLGKILFSTTIALMAMIFFVSLISFLLIYIWILFGLCSGYIHIASNNISIS